MCQFSSTLLASYSEITSLILQCQGGSGVIDCLKALSVLQRGLMTLSLWTNTPIVIHQSDDGDLEEADGDLSTPIQNFESWVSFLQLSSLVVTLDRSTGQIIPTERLEGSAIANTTQLVLPILLEKFLNSQQEDEMDHHAMECLSASFEFITGVLTAAKIIYLPDYGPHLPPTASAFAHHSLWSIFGCLDLVTNRILASLTTLPSLTTSNFQEFLLSTVPRGPFQLLSLLRVISSSLQISDEQSFYYNLTESIGVYLEGHLVCDP
jgi:hypothetical protein